MTLKEIGGDLWPAPGNPQLPDVRAVDLIEG
jgi:hypothetical protein